MGVPWRPGRCLAPNRVRRIGTSSRDRVRSTTRSKILSIWAPMVNSRLRLLGLVDRVAVAEPAALLLGEVEPEAQARGVDPPIPHLGQAPYRRGPRQGVCDLGQASGVGDAGEAVALLDVADAGRPGRGGDVPPGATDSELRLGNGLAILGRQGFGSCPKLRRPTVVARRRSGRRCAGRWCVMPCVGVVVWVVGRLSTVGAALGSVRRRPETCTELVIAVEDGPGQRAPRVAGHRRWPPVTTSSTCATKPASESPPSTSGYADWPIPPPRQLLVGFAPFPLGWRSRTIRA